MLFSLAAVGWWYASGDLSLWVWVQAAPMLAVVLVLAWLPGRYTHRRYLAYAFACYAAAKLFELGDAELMAGSGGLMGGHAMKHFAASAGDLHEMLGHLREGTPGLRDDLTAVLQEAAKALQTLRESAATVQALFGPRSGLSGELSETFERVQRAADSIEQLADLLQRNPSALVRGRTSEPAPAASTPP